MDIHVGIDVGGTFTDVAVNVPAANRFIHFKLPSTPGEPDRAIVAGVAQALSENGLNPEDLVRLSHGTTVGTNALIQRRCGRVALVTTEGFRDLIEIGRQIRPRMYDIHLDHPPPLVPRQLRFEVRERRRADGDVHVPLDKAGLAALADQLAEAEVDCVVVCFMNSYAWPEHEEMAVAQLRADLPPHVHVLSSTSVYPEFREYERFSTAVLNGALLTVMNAYLNRVTAGLEEIKVNADPKISQSAGGLMSLAMARRLPVRASLSGPAAGVHGASYRAAVAGFGDVITLDVGGTSTDVSLMRGGIPGEVYEHQIAGFPLRLPAIDVNAVGAGGGSIAWIDSDELLKVGPISAGADPGPACYALGSDDATVTDANVVLGRLNGEALLDGRMPIVRDLAHQAVDRLATSLGLGLTETALGIVQVSAATVVKAIRAISVERGYDPANFALYAFGGAGPLFAVDVARQLGIAQVIVPPHPGILCAEGLLNCDMVSDFVRSALVPAGDEAPAALNRARDELLSMSEDWFDEEGVPSEQRSSTWSIDMRYRGQNFEIAVDDPGDVYDAAACERLLQAFHAAHELAYGFASPDEPVEFVNLKLKGVARLDKPPLSAREVVVEGEPHAVRPIIFAGSESVETPIYRREELARGQVIEGPAVVEQLDSTLLVFPGDSGRVDDWGNLVISLAEVVGS
ncbi:MAG: methylhydantoinase [Alphaproteobacteria bacterium]|nr:methylhydantoinase [Alphaproteobacteria bacterium]